MNTTTSTETQPEIFYSSWGYDQTNINFYQVTRKTAKGVYVREIAQQAVPGSAGVMSQRVLPVPNQFTSDEKFHRLKPDGKSFHVTSYAHAWLWDGKDKYTSWCH